MHYNLADSFPVTGGSVTPKRLSLRWKETGCDGEIVATSRDGVNYTGDYWYEKDPERGQVQFRRFTAKKRRNRPPRPLVLRSEFGALDVSFGGVVMKKGRFRGGDVVLFQWGLRRVGGVVKEDRGPIGVRGRRLYSIEFLPEEHAEENSLIELPGEDLIAVGSVSE
jgi:hypothetical protein